MGILNRSNPNNQPSPNFWCANSCRFCFLSTSSTSASANCGVCQPTLTYPPPPRNSRPYWTLINHWFPLMRPATKPLWNFGGGTCLVGGLVGWLSHRNFDQLHRGSMSSPPLRPTSLIAMALFGVSAMKILGGFNFFFGNFHPENLGKSSNLTWGNQTLGGGFKYFRGIFQGALWVRSQKPRKNWMSLFASKGSSRVIDTNTRCWFSNMFWEFLGHFHSETWGKSIRFDLRIIFFRKNGWWKTTNW